jgi:hypothetical protein
VMIVHPNHAEEQPARHSVSPRDTAGPNWYGVPPTRGAVTFRYSTICAIS